MAGNALISIFNNLAGEYKYISSYRFSQDHLELYFNSIRRFAGCNNNPTARVVMAAIRATLMKADAVPSRNGNVIPLPNTEWYHSLIA